RALFVKGAVGDVSPARHGVAEMTPASRELASAVMAAWAKTPTSPQTPLRARTSTLTMPTPRLSLRNCVARWLPAGLTLPLGSAFPDRADRVGGDSRRAPVRGGRVRQAKRRFGVGTGLHRRTGERLSRIFPNATGCRQAELCRVRERVRTGGRGARGPRGRRTPETPGR